MKMEPDRIYFLDNPYPNGHEIKKFVWSGRIEEDESIWFDFHLETDNYYAEDDSDDAEEPDSDWKAKSVWGNYHSCKMSSTFWGGDKKGIKIKSKDEKLNFDDCLNSALCIDTIPLEDDFDYEDLAFNIYLLGHDSCGNHKLVFIKKENGYDIEWTGKIALTYSGSYDFEYDFIANMQDVKFEGFYYPKSWTMEKATKVFQHNLKDFEDYAFVDLNPKSNKREYKLMKIEE